MGKVRYSVKQLARLAGVSVRTIDNTIDHLKNKTMSNFERLYVGPPREQAPR
jgi:hypothetical protein